jgi:hypothetical protein
MFPWKLESHVCIESGPCMAAEARAYVQLSSHCAFTVPDQQAPPNIYAFLFLFSKVSVIENISVAKYAAINTDMASNFQVKIPANQTPPEFSANSDRLRSKIIQQQPRRRPWPISKTALPPTVHKHALSFPSWRPSSQQTTTTMPTRALPQASGMTAAHDPFEAVLLPPPNENEQERVARLSQEAEATRVSEEIDAAIRSERQKQKKRRIVRVLLLGQSESGA